MKVSFKVKAQPSLMVEAREIDFTKEVANAIWQTAKGCAEADFALKLFNSNGEIEVTDEQRGFIRNAVAGFAWWAKKPILEAMGETIQ